MKQLTIYCHTDKPQAVSVEITAVALTAEVKDVTVTLLANLPLANELTSVIAPMAVPDGLYALKLSSEQQFFILGLAYS